MDVPVDVVLAAGQLGLTAIQAELLAYLVLGLTNLEIAEATQVSEAAVRYRLTRLYRTLGVIGRREARRRAIELGIRGLDPEQASSGQS
jgi:DNA-binding NarL/FixJ family response regulator